MLDFLRKRKRSWVIMLFLVVIVLVFILWGVGSYIKEPRSAEIAQVNGEVISQREFEVQYQRLIEFYQGVLKGGLTQETLKKLNLRSAVVEELIQKHLLLQEARRLGLLVSDEELMETIAGVPAFQVNGRFDKSRYVQALRVNRLTPAQFETERRQQLTMQKLYDLVQDNIQVTGSELRERYRLEQERVNFYTVRLSASDFASQAQVTAEEVKKHYERNREALKEPLKVQAEYLAYPFDRFATQLQVGDKEIEEYYKANREAKFRQPKAVHLRHILVRFPPGGDLKQKQAVRLKAEAALQDARAGKDFAELARKYSDDPSSAQGGEAGWFTQGQMLPALDKVAFALKKGEVSGVVESTLGYHILKAEETREEKTKGPREAREEIVRVIKAERGRGEAVRAADADREKAIGGTDLSVLARERGLPLKVTPWFSSFDVVPEVGSVEDFNKAAFSLALNEVSQTVEGPNATYLLKIRQRREPVVPPLEGVRGDIEKRLKETRALELAAQKANALLGQLKKEKDIKKLAAEHGLKLEETGWFLRGDSEIPKIGVLEEAPRGGVPISAYQPIAERVYSQKTNRYLFAFKESQPPDMERFEKEKGKLQAQALTEKRQRAVQQFVEGLKAKAKISLPAGSLEES